MALFSQNSCARRGDEGQAQSTGKNGDVKKHEGTGRDVEGRGGTWTNGRGRDLLEGEGVEVTGLERRSESLAQLCRVRAPRLSMCGPEKLL